MLNELTYHIDPSFILDHLQEGKILRVRIHGPRREYIQVAVVPREDTKHFVKTDEAEAKDGDDR